MTAPPPDRDLEERIPLTREGDGIAALRQRVEGLSGPDREVDAEIVAALRYTREGFPDWAVNWAGPFVANPTLDGKRSSGRVALGHSNGKTGLHWSAEPLTGSLDAAVALLQRLRSGWWWSIEQGPEDTQARILDPHVSSSTAEAATPALALLAALLASLETDTAEPNGTHHD